MGKGPLAVRFLDWTLDRPEAGAVGRAHVELENDGTATWDDSIWLAYHWLDDRGNPIVWDDIWTPLPPLAPGERAAVEAAVRGPIPPGRYGFVLDLVAYDRAWFAELGGGMAPEAVEVAPRGGAPRAALPDWVVPAPGWAERVAAAHAEGYGVVAGAIDWDGGLLHRRPRTLDAYRPGPGRIPGFAEALLCPSMLDGVSLERLPDVDGLPAFAPPAEEPWLYDGRIVLTADPRRRGR
jgi:hypothetical protein